VRREILLFLIQVVGATNETAEYPVQRGWAFGEPQWRHLELAELRARLAEE
jgi:hypothetical protein